MYLLRTFLSGTNGNPGLKGQRGLPGILKTFVENLNQLMVNNLQDWMERQEQME
jgi:hypothetical protein